MEFCVSEHAHTLYTVCLSEGNPLKSGAGVVSSSYSCSSVVFTSKLGALHYNILAHAWYAICSSYGLVFGGTLACYWKGAFMTLHSSQRYTHINLRHLHGKGSDS